MQFPSLSCYLIPLRQTQHPVLEQLHPMLFSESQDQLLHPWAHPVHKQTAWHTLR